nr:AraC family transcriptional regulator [uncultured Oscillibacter sp.]
MKKIQNIEFYTGSKEERLPDFAADFPYLASRVELDQFMGRFVPWHWHRTVELFYMESGALVYHTPGGRWLFPAGSGGMVNSNVLHMTKPASQAKDNIQLLHMFDVSLLSGEARSRIGQKYITPLVTAPQLEMIALFPEDPVQADILKRIREAFCFADNTFGYEIRLREALTEIWLLLLEQSRPALEQKGEDHKNEDKIKRMMIYMHAHYAEKISIPELAASAFLSERECFRVFQTCLHMTPIEYLRSYRLQTACRMLAEGQESVTAVGHACGLGSSSYFGKVFREYTGCTPLAYRRKWQERDR